MDVEKAQADGAFTKNARPSVLYGGLALVIIIHGILPMLSVAFGGDGLFNGSVPNLSLPDEFWWTWGTVSSVYVGGRSAEKRGVTNSIISAITGAKGA